jgi:uncharacterized spore protein YtfJ
MREAMPEAANRLVRIETVRGEPYQVQGRRFIPVARVLSLGRARATIGTRGLGGLAWGLAFVKPLAMIEETASGGRVRRVAVQDGTARALLGMYLAALGISLLFAAVRWLARE